MTSRAIILIYRIKQEIDKTDHRLSEDWDFILFMIYMGENRLQNIKKTVIQYVL
jgi:hypothetical protein